MKELNYEIITAGERNEYFKEKMEILKENLQENLEEIDYGMGNTSKRSPKESGGVTAKVGGESYDKLPRRLKQKSQ